MSVIKNTFWSACAAILIAGSKFALSAICARLMDIEQFGRFIYLVWIVDLSILLFSFGANAIASRYLAEYHSEKSKYFAVLGLWRKTSILIPICSALGTLLIAHLSSLKLDNSNYILLAIWSFFNAFWVMNTAAQSGMRRFDNIFWANLAWAVVAMIGLSIVHTHYSFSYVLVMMILASISACLVGINITWKERIPKLQNVVDFKLRHLATYGINMWITALLWNLAWARGEFPIVRHILGDHALAVYGVSMSLVGGATQAIMLLVGGVLPNITMLWGKGEYTQAYKIIRNITELQLVITVFIGLLFVYLGSNLSLLIFGSKYSEALPILPILCLGLIALSFSAPNHLIQIVTNGKYNRNTTLLALILLWIFSVILTLKFSLVGSSLARALVLIILSAISYWYFNKRLNSEVLRKSNFILSQLLLVVGVALINFGIVEAFYLRSLLFVISLLVFVFLFQTDWGHLYLLVLNKERRSNFVKSIKKSNG